MSRRHLATTFVAATGLIAAPVGAALPCDADLDGSGGVGITDLVSLLSFWGTDPGGPPDFDGDGTVGITDLIGLLESWGPVQFDYGPPLPDPEAEQIGLEMLGPSGGLLVSPEDFERIDRDLDLIRAFEPALAAEPHSPQWLADQLLVSLVEGEPLDEYPCLNEVYRVIDEDLISEALNLWLITFAGNLNVEALGPIYGQAPEVNYAEPNFLIGGQNFWVPTDLGGGLWRWDIDDGFLDCFDGCDCHRLYVFEIDADGNVVLIDYQEVGQPWCDFG